MDKLCYYQQAYIMRHIFLFHINAHYSYYKLSTYSSGIQKGSFLMELFTKTCTGLLRGNQSRTWKTSRGNSRRMPPPPRASGGKRRGQLQESSKTEAEAVGWPFHSCPQPIPTHSSGRKQLGKKYANPSLPSLCPAAQTGIDQTRQKARKQAIHTK